MTKLLKDKKKLVSARELGLAPETQEENFLGPNCSGADFNFDFVTEEIQEPKSHPCYGHCVGYNRSYIAKEKEPELEKE